MIGSHALSLRVCAIAVTTFATLALGAPGAGASEPGSAQIVNGSEVSQADYAARWQFIVGITWQGSGAFCGGSLIDERTVVTAAHCVRDDSQPEFTIDGVWRPELVPVRVGSRSGSGGTVVPVERVVAHPSYESNPPSFDVAVLHLAERVPLPTIRLIGAGEGALWGNGAGHANQGWIAGWGNQQTGVDSQPELLRQARTPLRADAECASDSAPGYGFLWNPATMLCGGNPTAFGGTGVDTCQGDSGGPLIVEDGAGGYRLVGVTSWGEGCGETFLSVYARVASFRDWIDANRAPACDACAVTQLRGDDGTGGDGGGSGGAPSSVFASGTLTTLNVSWAGPGDAVDAYIVRARQVGGSYTRSTRVNGLSSFAVVRGLLPGRAWNVQVLAVRGGSTTASTAVRARTGRDRVAPTQPRITRVAARGARVQVTWRASRDNAGVARYEIAALRGRRAVRIATVGGRLRTARIAARRVPRGSRIVVRAVDLGGNRSRWSAPRRR